MNNKERGWQLEDRNLWVIGASPLDINHNAILHSEYYPKGKGIKNILLLFWLRERGQVVIIEELLRLV